tara:strand:- start:188 stop:418 length:231 start_codon:yes stop_codon:yes gene_type:complete
MTVSTKEIKNLLEEKLPNSQIEVIDQLGDGYHYQINVASNDFAGLTKLKQHRKVMDVLKEYLKEKIHAVSIKTTSL